MCEYTIVCLAVHGPDGRGCRFKLATHVYLLAQGTPGTPLGVALTEGLRNMIHSGVDYWQRRLHAHLMGHDAGPSPDTAAIRHPARPRTSSSAPHAAPEATAISPPGGDLAGGLHLPVQRRLRTLARAH